MPRKGIFRHIGAMGVEANSSEPEWHIPESRVLLVKRNFTIPKPRPLQVHSERLTRAMATIPTLWKRIKR